MSRSRKPCRLANDMPDVCVYIDWLCACELVCCLCTCISFAAVRLAASNAASLKTIYTTGSLNLSCGCTPQVWVKGRAFRLPELLGGDRQYASLFAGGPLLVFRLCPQDYHRFHSPVDGTIEEIVEIPGAVLIP